MTLHEKVTQAFIEKYKEPPEILIRAPGRVNLIGEHVDYNDGFVMPLAIDRAVWIALRPRSDGHVHLHSLDYGEELDFAVASIVKERSTWREYVKGVAWVLLEEGFNLTGWEGVMTGNVPMGAGLSSSAALEMGIVRTFMEVSGFSMDASKMALIGQRAENDWVGVNCGIMDQMISAGGENGHALLIDCRSLDTSAMPLPEGSVVVVLDTTTRRGLVDSAYNERRMQCESASSFFKVSMLRDVSMQQIESQPEGLDSITWKRARHVITENERTLAAADAMKSNDGVQLGELMYNSHISLRDDFEVSNDALNSIVECAMQIQGCYGARMTGAGFGGCAVALIESDSRQSFIDQVTACYREKTELTANIYVCEATNGAEAVDL